MITKGKPELGLQKHQQKAYEAVQKAYMNKNTASVVIPTGCGKSFIALQLMADNRDKNILFLAPTYAIKNQMYNYIAKYIVGEEPSNERPSKMIAEEFFPNLKIVLYPSLLRIEDNLMERINPNIIIMDELHRTGADKWGEKINTLLEKNPNAKILGLTATPDRMDDKNVIDDLFEGNVDYELTLVEAIRRRIVKAPTYIKCDYALGEYLEGIRTAIANCDDEQQKLELQAKFDKMRKIVDQAEGIPELFAKNISKRDGKYIIFCKDKEHMDQMMSKAKEWFGSIDSEPEIYSVFSGEGYSTKENKKTIESFEKSKSEHIKLLYSIEMLNEGLHVEDISGVIMARPTDSRIIYLQQLGRALSSDTSREKTIVFDLVNNYLKNNLDAEVNRKIERNNNNSNNSTNRETRGEIEYETEDIDIFRIQGEAKEFLELLSETQEIIDQSQYLLNARAIKAWIEKSGRTKLPSTTAKDEEEKRLAIALSRIRERRIKPYRSLKSEEEKENYREKHPEIDEILEIINEIDKNNTSPYLINARAIKEWIKKSGGTNPPSQRKAKDEEEKRLAIALASIIGNLIKPYRSLESEEEKVAFREKYPEIDEILEIINEIERNNPKPPSAFLINARKIKEWIEKSGDTNPPKQKSNNKEESKLGSALTGIRVNLIKPYMILESEEERKEYREKHPEIDEVMEIINEIDRNTIRPPSAFLINARRIREWIKKSGKTLPSTDAENQEEQKLATALQRIRKDLINPYMRLESEEEKEEYKEKHPEIDEVIEIVNEIDKNRSAFLINARAIKKWIEKSGDTKLPSARKAKDEEEKRLGSALQKIRSKLINPYMRLKNEKEREAFRKENPEIDEVLEIINEIERNNSKPPSAFLINARKIKEWIEKSGDTRLPSSASEEEEEKKLGIALSTIRVKRIKPYISLESDEEKDKYREEHPEIDEILDIISELDMKCGTKKQQELAILIRQDLEKRKVLKEAKKLEQSYEQQLSIKGKQLPENTQEQGENFNE